MSDLKCWMCEGRGAVRSTAAGWWVPFRPEPQGNIRLDHGEHPCPACGGGDNPPTELERQIREREQRQRQIEVTLDRPAGRVARPPTGEGSAPVYDAARGV